MEIEEQIELLAIKIKDSDEEAFNQLFQILWQPLFIFAQSIIMNEEKAKDIVQESWINYWDKRSEIDIVNIRAFLYQTVRFKIYKELRDNKFNSVQLEVISNLSQSPEIVLEHNLQHKYFDLNRALSKLSPRCKEIFDLKVNFDFNNEEISNKLNISKRTVDNQLSLARKAIESVLFFIIYLIL